MPTLADDLERQERAVTAIKRRVQPAVDDLSSRPLTRDELHRILDACIDLEEHASAIGGAARHAGRELGQALLLGALGWIEGIGKAGHTFDWAKVRTNPKDYRAALAARLLHVPALLPRAERLALSDALSELNDGTGRTPDLLQPYRSSVHKSDPEMVDFCEEMILFWHSWRAGQIGSHGKYEQAWRDLEAAPLAPRNAANKDNAQKWLSRARKRHGEEAFDRQLSIYEMKGKAGTSFSQSGLDLDAYLEARLKAKEKLADVRRDARSKQKN